MGTEVGVDEGELPAFVGVEKIAPESAVAAADFDNMPTRALVEDGADNGSIVSVKILQQGDGGPGGVEAVAVEGGIPFFGGAGVLGVQAAQGFKLFFARQGDDLA